MHYLGFCIQMISTIFQINQVLSNVFVCTVFSFSLRNFEKYIVVKAFDYVKVPYTRLLYQITFTSESTYTLELEVEISKLKITFPNNPIRNLGLQSTNLKYKLLYRKLKLTFLKINSTLPRKSFFSNKTKNKSTILVAL